MLVPIERNDFVSQQAVNSGNYDVQEPWTAKAVREMQLLGEGATGFLSASEVAFSEQGKQTTAKLVTSAGVGFAMNKLLAADPSGLVKRSVGVGMGAAFLVDMVGNGTQVADAMADTWRSSEHWNRDAAIMRKSLGQFGFDSLLMTAGGIGGGKLAEAAPGKFLRVFSERTSRLSSRFPDFTEEGLLPPGEHALTWPEFQRRFGYNETRSGLLKDLQNAAGDLKNAGVKEIQVGGSFVTTKPEPGDYDAAWNAAKIVREAVPPYLAGVYDTGLAIKGDIYTTDHNFPDIGRWSEALQHPRNGSPRGIVKVDLSTMPSKQAPSPETVESWRAENRRNFEEQARNETSLAHERALRQTNVDALLSGLPTAVKQGESGIIKWLSDFGDINENTSFDHQAVGKVLMAAGYMPRARVGDPLVESDRTIFAEWLIGQCTAKLMKGDFVPHFARTLANKYWTMQSSQ